MDEKNNVNVVVFTQSADLDWVASCVKNCGNDSLFVCLTSHKLFDLEEEYLKSKTARKLLFSCFADYLTDSEMAWCDVHAFEVEFNKNGNKPRTANEYFQCIKIEKNKLILKKLKDQYEFLCKYLCSKDLGVDSSVWINAGFKSYVKQEPEVSSVESISRTCGGLLNRLLKALNIHEKYREASKIIYEKLFILKTAEEKYLFMGSIERLRPHLESVEILPVRPIFFISFLAFLLLILARFWNYPRKVLFPSLKQHVIALEVKRNKIDVFLSSLHEYCLSHSEIAERVNVKLVLLQDGFLPVNYESRYLYYCFGVSEFWVWDKLSLGLFDKQGLPARKCSFLKSWELPLIKRKKQTLSKIVVVTSGAGDWTALKNRSDDDLLVMAFVDIAKKFPHVEIIYRCHPLWAHPLHMGVDSIMRVDRYFKQFGMTNIRVSGGAIKQSERFVDDEELYVPPSSLAKDIECSDIVFGEHSIAMIDAARKGILFCSVNLTERRNLFDNYTKLGFLHCKNLGEIELLLNKLEANTAGDILEQYNKAVAVYNNSWD